jgi:hypothetical protein
MSKYTKAHSMVGFNPEGRPEYDFYPTPERGTLALLNHEIFNGDIWECACGDGSMGKVIETFGYNIIATDLFPRDYGYELDFLTSTKLLAPNIVTNPPFKFAQQFLEHALELGVRKLALLCKIQFLEGVKRSIILENSPLSKVLVFRRRLTIMREGTKPKGGGMMTYAWFIWEKELFKSCPRIDWI